MGVITALEIQKRNKERVNVYIDNEYALSLTLIEAAHLHKGQELSPAEIAALQTEDEVSKAVDSAARFLAYRPRSVYEVRRNLTEKDLPPAVIEAALERLSAMSYLDDQAFARYWVENRTTFKPLGPAALRYELKQKGVANDIITAVLAEMPDPDEAAYRAALGQTRRLRGLNQREFRLKIGGFLRRRGFPYETTHSVVQRLIDELESADAEFFGSES